jgi:hypothetical protein
MCYHYGQRLPRDLFQYNRSIGPLFLDGDLMTDDGLRPVGQRLHGDTGPTGPTYLIPFL